MEIIGYETIVCKCGHERTVEIHDTLRKRTRYPDLCLECKTKRTRELSHAWYIRLKTGEPPPIRPKKQPDQIFIPPPRVTASYVQDLQGSRLEKTLNEIAQGKLSIAGVR